MAGSLEYFSSNEHSSDRSNRRKYECITDEDRLKLILLIRDFNMSCHKAARILGIAYNNAKVIHRIFKSEKRIKQTPKYLKRHAKIIREKERSIRLQDRQKRHQLLMLNV